MKTDEPCDWLRWSEKFMCKRAKKQEKGNNSAHQHARTNMFVYTCTSGLQCGIYFAKETHLSSQTSNCRFGKFLTFDVSSSNLKRPNAVYLFPNMNGYEYQSIYIHQI